MHIYIYISLGPFHFITKENMRLHFKNARKIFCEHEMVSNQNFITTYYLKWMLPSRNYFYNLFHADGLHVIRRFR